MPPSYLEQRSRRVALLSILFCGYGCAAMPIDGPWVVEVWSEQVLPSHGYSRDFENEIYGEGSTDGTMRVDGAQMLVELTTIQQQTWPDGFDETTTTVRFGGEIEQTGREQYDVRMQEEGAVQAFLFVCALQAVDLLVCNEWRGERQFPSMFVRGRDL